MGSIVIEAGGHLTVSRPMGGAPALETLEGNLTLKSGSYLDITLSSPSTTDPLIVINAAGAPGGGTLTLGGTLNITDGGSMTEGSYLLITYTSSVSGTLSIGTAPSDYDYTVDTTSVSGQVLLTVAAGGGLYWNGTTVSGSGPLVGGNGTWTADSSTLNWTNADGTTHVASDATKAAIFSGTAGTVTIDASSGAVGAKGLTFLTSGYEIGGDTLTLANSSSAPKVDVDGTGSLATISSVLAGSDGLEKTGDGTLILSGVNTYTGDTAISAGTLQIASAGSLGAGSYAGDLSLASGTTFDYGSSAAQTLSGAISGAGALTVSGSGTLTLSGSNTYSGATSINSGAVVVSGGSAIGDSSAVTVASGASLTLNANETIGSLAGAGTVTLANVSQITAGGDDSSTTFSGEIAGIGSFEKAGTGTLTLDGASSFTGVVTVSAGTMVLSGGSALAGTTELNLSTGATLELVDGSQSLANVNGAGGTIKLNDNTLTVGADTATGTFAGTITGTGGLTKVGGLNQFLTGTNTFTGPVHVEAGKLFLQNGSAIADSVAVTVDAGAELVLRDSETIGSLAGSGDVLAADGAYVLTTGGNNASTTFSGSLIEAGGSSVLSLVKTGTGTFTLTGDNSTSFTAGTTVLGGVLQIGDGGTSGNIGDVDTGSGLTTGALVFNRSDDFTYSGGISGSGTLEKKGSGTMILGSSNTGLTGLTTVSEGTLDLTGSLGGDVAVKSGATLLGGGVASGTVSVESGATLSVVSGIGFTVGAVEFGATSTFTFLAEAPTANNAIYSNGDVTLDGTLQVNAGSGFASGTYRLIDFTGTLTDDGMEVTAPAHSLYAIDTSTANEVNLVVALGQWWNGSNTTGGSDVDGGTGTWNVQAGTTNWTSADGSAADAWGQGGLAIFGGSSGTVTIAGTTNPQVAGIEFLTSGYVVDGATPANAIRLVALADGYVPEISVAEGTATINSLLTGGTGFEKTGEGTLVLSRSNSIEGEVAVSAGTLQFSGAASVAGTIVVKSGAAFVAESGATGGSTLGMTVESGATLQMEADGTSHLSVGSLLMQGSSVINIGLGAPSTTAALSTGNGDLILSGTLNLLQRDGYASGTYRLFDFGGQITNSGLVLGTTQQYSLTALDYATSGQVNLLVAAAQWWNGSTVTTGSSVQGGDGDWIVTNANINWTDETGAATNAWTQGSVAIFAGAAGTVTVSGATTPEVAGMHFLTSGYSLTGGDISLVSFNGQAPVLTVGDATPGSAGIAASIASDLSGSAGLVKAGMGTLTLTGDNAMTGDTVVSAGSLVFAGGTSTAETFYVGRAFDTSGAATLTGVGTSLALGSSGVIVGDKGTGEFTIADGAVLTSGWGAVAYDVGSVGQVTVTGADTRWDISSQLSVGYYGTGTMEISGGAKVTASNAVIGYFDEGDGATGTLTITGPDSSLDLGTGEFDVGYYNGGTVTISNGAKLSTGWGYIGIYSGSYGEYESSVTVTGANSNWTLNGFDLQIGYSYDDTSGALTVSDGGTVDSGTVTLGVYDASRGEVTVTGAGSKLDTGGAEFYAGYYGDGTVTVADGGAILSGDLYLGNNSEHFGIATITGEGSIFDVGTAGIYMGEYGSDATLAVTDGGAVIAGQIVKDSEAASAVITVDDGTLRASADMADYLSGFAAGDITFAAGGGTIDTNGFDIGIASVLGGAGELTKAGLGTLTLTADNSYAGGTTVSAGTLEIGNGGVTGAVVGAIANSGTVAFNRSDDIVAAGAITGSGALVQKGAGKLTLVGSNSAAAGTTVEAGTLEILNGVSLTSNVTVKSGGTLQGETSGTSGAAITGAVSVENGGTLAAVPVTTAGAYGLSMTSLTLAESANVNVTLGSNTGNAVFSADTLALDGVLNVTDGGSMALGVYRLIDYTTLTSDDGLVLGTTPTDFAYTIEVVPNQVNLTVLSGEMLYWNGTTTTPDGTIQGGSGTWSASPSDLNWLTSPLNQSRAWNSQFAVFAGTAGDVTVSGTVATTGMQFMVDGYTVDSGTITLASTTGQTQIRVGDGSAAGASYVATIGSVIEGTTGLEKTDLGTLVLTGANTYSGDTTVTQGTLQIGNGGTSGSIGGNVSVAALASLSFNRTDAVSFDGDISGAGALVQAGTGTLTLTGTNTYTGGTTISAGTLEVGDGGTSGTLAGDVLNNGALVFNRSDATSFAGAISGTGTLEKAGSGTLTLSGANSFTGATTVSAGGLALMGGASLADGARLTVASGATLELVNADETVGSLAGAGDIALNGYCLTSGGDGSTSSFSGAISGSGCLTKTGEGTLTLTGVNTYGGGTTVSGGTVQASAASALGTGALALVGGGTFQASDSFTWASAISLTPVEGTGGGTLSVDPTKTLTVSGEISGTGALTKTGTGTLVLTGANTFSGATNVDAGTLQIGGGTSLSDTARLTVAGEASLLLTDADETVGSLAGDGSVGLNGHCLTAGGDGTSSTFSGSMTGPGCLTKTGDGTLTLTGTNSLTGPTTISGGAIQVTAADALGSGTLSLEGEGTLRASDTFTYGSAISLTPVSDVGGGTFEVDDSKTLTLTGAITGTGALDKTGTGTLVISGTNSASGATNVSAGTLIAEGGSALGDTSAVSVAAGASLILRPSGTETVGSLAGAGTVTLEGTRLATGSDNSSTSFSGVLEGTGGLDKDGTGTLTLSGANTYTGDTNVNGGTLVVDGSVAGDIYVYDAATLAGSGTVTQTVHVLDGGTLAGVQPTGLTMGALDMQSGASMNVTLGSTTSGGVFTVNGDVTLDGTLNVTPAGGFGIGIYRIVNYTGTLTDNGMEVGAISDDLDGGVQTSVAGQVNLYVEDPNSPILFWNGSNTTATQSVLGGTGTWTAGAQTNWINASGTIPRAWNGGFAVFQSTSGTVTIDNTDGQVSATGLQFVDSGYVVSGGALALTGDSRATIRVGDGTQAGASTVATIGSVLTGTHGIEKADYGTLILTGANSYTGGTVISAGALQIGDGGVSGSILGDVLNDGVLAFNRSDAVTMAGEISGSGALVQAGSGTLYLTGANTYSGGTTITGGTLRVDAVSAIGSGGLTIGEAGTFRASGSFTLGRSVVLEGTASTAGTLEVDAAQTLTLSGVISGESGLTKTGDGLLILTGTNTFTGVTTISAGTLQIGDGGTAGSIVGDVVNNASLVFNRSDTYAFTGAITGSGAVTFTGGGTVLFSAPYTGAVTVEDTVVQLVAGSSTASPFTLNDGGVLGGTASIGALNVNSGGTVAPGYSPGTLTVNGPVSFNAGSVYRVDVTVAGEHDLITASGPVTLSSEAGVEVVAAAGRYPSTSTITILSTSSTLTGTFGSVTSDFAFLAPELTYDAQNVYLTLVYNGFNFIDYAHTPNQANVAVAAQALGKGNAVYEAIFALPEAAVAPALDQLSGEIYASAQTVIQQQSIYLRDAVGTRLRQSLTAPSAGALSYAAQAAGPATAQLGQGLTPTLWAQGFGSWGEVSGNANAASVDSTVGGVFGGIDVAVSDNVRLGLIGGYSRTSFDVDARSSSGSMSNYDIGLYAGAQFDALALRGGASYTWHDIAVSRSVSFPGNYGANDGDYTLGTTQLFGEIGYDMSAGAYAFEPFIGLAYVNISGASFSEDGATASALAVDTPSQNTFYTTLGLRAATSFTVAGHTLTTSATLGWQHAFGDTDSSVDMLFASGGTTPFTIQGVPIAEDVAVVGLGLGYQLSDTAQLQFNYAGQLADEANQNTFSAQFSLRF
ncbi:autotransporter-associated beta strand repeat-containing protein [Ancylobacter sp. IITR112]|uniref:autotransporter-associated beta strand repeat-containing protein n=1 Tax=Ancylobacter sp. IITR112 TaxID=3138073 RepID=UPI00352A9E4C